MALSDRKFKVKILFKVNAKVKNYSKSTKAYSAPLKIFLNNRKLPVIPPFFHKNKFVTDFKEKA